MSLTCETMDEYTAEWKNQNGAPDAEQRGDVVVAVVVLIEDGDLRVDPLELF